MASNERHVLSPADRLEIQDLYGRYVMCADDGDAEGWADCFTPDAEFTAAGTDFVAVGREQLITMVRGHIESPRGAVLHHNTSLCVDGTPDGAHGRAYLMEVFDLQTVSSVRYDDDLVKVDGAWKFKRRTVTPKGLAQI
jgi:hypothetical protein